MSYYPHDTVTIKTKFEKFFSGVTKGVTDLIRIRLSLNSCTRSTTEKFHIITLKIVLKTDSS